MQKSWISWLQVDVAGPNQRGLLAQIAAQRNWGIALILTGWLHLLAFGLCYYLTIARNYHEAGGYLSIWAGELLGAWLIFRGCGGPRPATLPAPPLEHLVRRIWIAYFILGFNLGSMNTLRGHQLFEFFPAIASLASFAFIMMTLVVSWRFMGAVLVMFSSGLLMAAHLLHAYLIFALAWWVVLNWIGWQLRRARPGLAARPPASAETMPLLLR